MEQEQESNQTQDNNIQQPEIIEDSATDREKRQEIVNKFYNLSSSIKNSLESLKSMLRNKEMIGFRQYASLTIEQEEETMKIINSLNQDLGTARNMLDSYVTFTRSQPDFEKFLNLFYNFHKFITDHRNTIFYQVNSIENNFYYPYSRFDNGINKLSFLFSRLCGTLDTAGDYIMDMPTISRQSSPSMGDGQGLPWRGGGLGYGESPYYNDWRAPFMERDYGQRREQKKVRDIGDVDDKI